MQKSKWQFKHYVTLARGERGKQSVTAHPYCTTKWQQASNKKCCLIYGILRYVTFERIIIGRK